MSALSEVHKDCSENIEGGVYFQLDTNIMTSFKFVGMGEATYSMPTNKTGIYI